MNRPNMTILAGLALAMMANFATGQEPGKSEFTLDNVPIASGTEEPRVMRFEVSGIDSGVANSGAQLNITYQLQESAGNFPLDWKLVARIAGQSDTTIAQGSATQPLTDGTASYTVPAMTQPTEVTLAFEMTNSAGQHAAVGVNEEMTFTVSPARQPAGPTARRQPQQRPNGTLPAGQPQQPETPAVEQPIEPAPAGQAISNVRVRLEPVVGGRMPVLTWSATGENLTMTVTDDTGAVLATGPTGRIELPTTEPTNQEQRREVNLEVSDGNGGSWSMTTELVIRPESRQQRLDVDPRRRDHDVYAEVPEAARRIRHEEEFGVTDTNTLMRLYLEKEDGTLSERVVMTPRYRLTDLGDGRYQLPGYPRRIGRLSRD